jgi:hypothetical protein
VHQASACVSAEANQFLEELEWPLLRNGQKSRTKVALAELYEI